MDVGSESACGEYSHCWSYRSFSFTFEKNISLYLIRNLLIKIHMKQNYRCLIILVTALVGCGGGGSNSETPEQVNTAPQL